MVLILRWSYFRGGLIARFYCMYVHTVHMYVRNYTPKKLALRTYQNTQIQSKQAPVNNTLQHMYVSVYIRTYVHTHIRTYTHTYIRTYIHTYIHTYVHTYMHTYVRTYVSTESPVSKRSDDQSS